MFRTIQIGRKSAVVFAAILLVLIAVCVLLLRSGAPQEVKIEGESLSLHITDDADIEAFIKKAGFAPEGLVSDEIVTVPMNWNDRYEAYQKLQRSQGFDLTPYKGKTARQLVYATGESDDYVTVLTADGRIIAAHVSAPDGSGQRALIQKE